MESMKGEAELFCKLSTPDEMRELFARKSRVMQDKRMSVRDAVAKFVSDGDYMGVGGFGHVRIPMVVLYEIIRQRKRNLGFAGHTGVHDLEILLAGGCVDRVEAAYSFGHEFRPMRSRVADRLLKSGKVKTSEWTNGSFSWRYKAAAMGLSFIPQKIMLGTDTFKHSAARTVTCPFTGEVYCALPALYPDLAVIHVHRADKYGNCQIDGITVADHDLARAAKKVIVSTEKIIDTEEIRRRPQDTVIPYYVVDAVCEVPYGCHPGDMPYLYWFDEEHMAEFLKASQTEQTMEEYLNKYVYGVNSFEEYLELCGGVAKLNYLKRVAELREVPASVW